MAKIRTINDLQDRLDEEFSWRLKEISDLRSAVRASKDLSKGTLVRAGMALLYAHWEGFVKSTSSAYLEYIARGGHSLADLQPCFVFMCVRSKLGRLQDARKVEPGIEALRLLVEEMQKDVSVGSFISVDTEFNLSSTVFDNISRSINIDTAWYSPFYKLIDESLLGRRNRIAHGEYLDIDADEWRTLAAEILTIMRSYKTDIENAASLRRFRRDP